MNEWEDLTRRQAREQTGVVAARMPALTAAWIQQRF